MLANGLTKRYLLWRMKMTRYEAGCYFSISEAVLRIWCFHIHEWFPPVMYLAFHLENGQGVYYTRKRVTEKINNLPKTTLLVLIDLCKTNRVARTLLYYEVPSYYVCVNVKQEETGEIRYKERPGFGQRVLTTPSVIAWSPRAYIVWWSEEMACSIPHSKLLAKLEDKDDAHYKNLYYKNKRNGILRQRTNKNKNNNEFSNCRTGEPF